MHVRRNLRPLRSGRHPRRRRCRRRRRPTPCSPCRVTRRRETQVLRGIRHPSVPWLRSDPLTRHVRLVRQARGALARSHAASASAWTTTRRRARCSRPTSCPSSTAPEKTTYSGCARSDTIQITGIALVHVRQAARAPTHIVRDTPRHLPYVRTIRNSQKTREGGRSAGSCFTPLSLFFYSCTPSSF